MTHSVCNGNNESRDRRLVSIVVPVYNEEPNIRPLYATIRQATEGLEPCEQVYVDDGSRDDTFALLKEIQKKDPQVKVVRLSRNFGQTAALAAGISHSCGEVVITLDGDLQNDPADIPKLIAKLDEGYDLVNGWRIKRQDRFISRRLPSILANRLISSVTKVKLHDYGCTLKAYRGETARALSLYGEMHRFIPVLAADLGARIAEIAVNHRERRHGSSKYGISRTIRVILDLITVKFLTSYWTRPLHVFGSVGILATVAGLSLTGYLTLQKLLFGESLANRPILLLGILLIVVGVQFVSMGLLGEMLVRIYHEAQGKPVYTVREILGAERPVKATAANGAEVARLGKTLVPQSDDAGLLSGVS
jgi:glycosyltransferase involved in cell wall biosynthesis